MPCCRNLHNRNSEVQLPMNKIKQSGYKCFVCSLLGLTRNRHLVFSILSTLSTTIVAGLPDMDPILTRMPYSHISFSAGRTGHAEVVRVVYHPDKISFANLLKVFWESHNPTQGTVCLYTIRLYRCYTLFLNPYPNLNLNIISRKKHCTAYEMEMDIGKPQNRS